MAFVENGEEFFLSFIRQAVHLIKQQISAVRLLHQTGFILTGAGKCALPMAEQMRREQLRVMRILGAVKVDQRRGGTRRMLAGKTVHQFGKESFTYPGGAGQQYMEPVRIKHRCAAFFYRITEAAIVANQAAEGIIR